jgi:hypothetical protein
MLAGDMRNNLSQWLLVILLVVGAFVGGAFWREWMSSALSTSDPCSVDSRSYQLLTALLRRFEDAAALAVNLTRDRVVDQVEQLQSIRRDVESLPVPACQSPVKMHMLNYMNQVVDLLVAFVGGVQPDLVFRGLSSTEGLRAALHSAMAYLTGATVTPYPTAFQFSALITSSPAAIPVTDVSATPSVETQIYAVVSNDQGANLRAEPNSDSAFVLALPPETVVSVQGVSADRLWIYVSVSGGEVGWLYAPLLTLNAPMDSLPVTQ